MIILYRLFYTALSPAWLPLSSYLSPPFYASSARYSSSVQYSSNPGTMRAQSLHLMISLMLLVAAPAVALFLSSAYLYSCCGTYKVMHRSGRATTLGCTSPIADFASTEPKSFYGPGYLIFIILDLFVYIYPAVFWAILSYVGVRVLACLRISISHFRPFSFLAN